ncbi:unnamed protein product [Caenorhabditis auriculariae]|uniref:BTB domain-containing protein n=1 Tax=Caenorhabditis auriculariae TaxID=2777116 RepID=A0A8S1GPG5_9PELO|nr:unnamed protein product [Caenorhabditis auriculariae]
MRTAIAWEQYSSAREQLQSRIAEKIRRQMSSLVGDMESADLLLVAADGKKLAAHECILRARAPGFYHRHVEATVAAMGPRQEGKLREVAIGDIDSVGLEFFIHSVYTEEEFAQIPLDQNEDRQETASRSSNRSYAMDESTTELDFQMAGADEKLDDETPTLAGRPPLVPYSMSGIGSYPNSPRKQVMPTAMSVSAGPYPLNGPYPIMGSGVYGHCSVTNSAPSVPVMTSFRDLATGSPMNSSIYSLGGRSEVADIPEEDEDCQDDRKPKALDNRPMSKFIRLDSITNGNEAHKEYLERKRSSGGTKQIFPMFIGLSDSSDPLERGSDNWRGSNRLSLSKRMSMTSLTSLTSIDITPGQDGQPPVGDMTACSRLAADLMQMYVNNEDTDVVIRTEGGDIHAHKCILSATCPFFRQQLQKSKRIEMRGFTRSSIHYLLMFLYGGVTSLPDDVDVWEIVALAAHLNHKDLAQVVILHLKATKCHWFHRPCAACVSAVFDCLPQLASIRCLRPLYEEALAWQAKHFARVWKGRVFLYLNERWQKEAYEAVIQYMDDETVIDLILGSERLQVALSRSKSDSSVAVLGLVDDILDVAMQFLLHSFHLVVTSKSFQQQGKGLALNLGLLEDLLPSVIHSLSADVAIKTYKGLTGLLSEIQQAPPSPKRTLSILVDEWSPRFCALIRRMVELTDKHLLHYAASVVRADAWNLLSSDQKQRIEETGIFVELRQPKAAPPRLSSHSRSYKRSASAGVQPNGPFSLQRAKSAERSRPLSTIQNRPQSEESTKEDDKKTLVPGENTEKAEENIEKPSTTLPEKKTSKLESPKRSKSRGEKVQEKTGSKAIPTTETAKVEKSESRTDSPRGRDPIRRSPAKKKVMENEEMKMERQVTHTIITLDKARAAQLPGPDSQTSKVSTEKPKSVVKPMVKDVPLASSANRTITRDRISQRRTEQAKSATSGKSSIPTATKPTGSRPNSGKEPSRIPAKPAVPTSTSRIARNPRIRMFEKFFRGMIAFWAILPALALGANLPPFFLGRPPGGARNYQLQRHLSSVQKLDTQYPYLVTANFTQKLDHFDPYNTATWNQKYYYNPLYSRNNSIIFLMIGGEGPESSHWAAYPEVQYLQWAKEYGAAVFDLEHRFFGDSWPIPNMDVSSLRYLTTEQALADLAYFIQSMNQKYGFDNPRWVTFGGSYPGSLSAWFRSKYPELTVGAVASSAPLNLKLDFYEYAMVVNDDLKITDPACYASVQAGFTGIQQLTLTPDGRNQLNNIFQPKFDNKTTKLDINNFFGNLYNAYQGMTQYTYDGQSDRTHQNMTVRAMCNVMTDPKEPDPVKRVHNLFLWYNYFDPAGPDLSVLPNSYWDVINQLKTGNLTALGEDGAAARGWMWLCCNEIGFMQTTDQGKNVFGSTVPLNLFIDMCTDMFDDSVKMNFVYNRNLQAQNFYGGTDYYTATNIVLPNGSLDPWHALGLYKDNANAALKTILINGTAHCSDMYPTYVGEPPALPAARATIKQNVQNFIRYDPSKDGPSGFSSSLLSMLSVVVPTLVVSPHEYSVRPPGNRSLLVLFLDFVSSYCISIVMASPSTFYDPHNDVSYVQLNKRKRGDYDRHEGDKLVNRLRKPAVKKIYVKRNGEELHTRPKLFVWRQWQSPKLSHFLEDVGPYVGLDEGANAIYQTDGRQIVDEEDIQDLETYYITGDEQLLIPSRDDGYFDGYNRRRSDPDFSINRNISSRNRGKAYDDPRHTSLNMRFSVSNPPTPPPKVYDARRYSPEERLNSKKRLPRTQTGHGSYDVYYNEAINELPRKPTNNRSEYRPLSVSDSVIAENSVFDTAHTIRRDREAIEKHKHVFLNGQGMNCQFMNFQRKQLEKGMNYVLELIARRFNVNPFKLCNMDGKKIGEVSSLMSRGAYVLVPAGQSFRDTWYFLPDNAIDTSSDSNKIEDRSAQRDRLLQRRSKKKPKNPSYIRSKSEEFVRNYKNEASGNLYGNRY